MMHSLKLRRRSFVALLAIGAVTVVATGSRSFAAGETELDPLKVCSDTQKLIKENSFVRIIDERLPPGASQAKHRHPHGVTVAMSEFENEGFSFTDNKATHTRRKMGEVNWVEEVVHSGKNVGTTEQHVIRIELKY
jgi:hypothetical protein